MFTRTLIYILDKRFGEHAKMNTKLSFTRNFLVLLLQIVIIPYNKMATPIIWTMKL